jgi:hypothetical protein
VVKRLLPEEFSKAVEWRVKIVNNFNKPNSTSMPTLFSHDSNLPKIIYISLPA